MDLAGNAGKALRIVRESHDVVYDTETSGLDWRIHAPIGYVVGNDEESVYVPIRHGGGGNLLGVRPLESPTAKWERHPFEEELARAFTERNTRFGMGRVIGHNIKFDAHSSANAGIYLGRRMACTQNMEAILDEYARHYSLEACAERHGVQAKKGQDLYEHMARMFGGTGDRKQMEHFWRTAGNDPIVVDYTEGDGVSTIQLYRKQTQLIEQQTEEHISELAERGIELVGTGLQVVAELENDLIWTLFRMERFGIAVSLDRADELRRSAEKRISALLRHFPNGFNTRSPLQVRKVIEDAGHTDWPVTPKHGNPSFTESWLKRNPVGKRIIAIRQASNLINSFVNPLAERHVFRGRVHATLNQLKSDDKGTISGRFSCNDPNLQQVPKRVKELAIPFRRLFVADQGKIFWERDYSQCEPRLFAHYSQDPALLAGYNAEPFVDAHQVVADLLKVERDPTAKRMNMGIFTGMQPRSFAGHMGWDYERAAEAHRTWFQKFHRVKLFQDNAKARLRSRGYVYTLLGRRCRLEEPRFAYRGTSKIIQGSNADIVKDKLLRADRMCEDAGDIVRILMTVHDSYNGQRDDTPEAEKLMGEIIAEMEDVRGAPFNLTVPFLTEGEEGQDWAEASFGSKAANWSAEEFGDVSDD